MANELITEETIAVTETQKTATKRKAKADAVPAEKPNTSGQVNASAQSKSQEIATQTQSIKRVKKAAKARKYTGPRISTDARAVMEAEYTIGCYAGQQMVHRNLEFISSKLFNLSVIIPVLSNNEKVSGEIENMLIGYFESCENDFKKATDDMRNLLKDNNIVGKASFKKALVKKVTLDNPYTGRFMRCIMLMDDWTREMETAFIQGMIPSPLRNKLITGWRRRIKELANAINKLEGRARNAVNRNGMAQAAINAGAVLDGGSKKLIDIDKEVEDDTETDDVNAAAA